MWEIPEIRKYRMYFPGLVSQAVVLNFSTPQPGFSRGAAFLGKAVSLKRGSRIPGEKVDNFEFQALRAQAKTGDARAQYEVGCFYFDRIGTPEEHPDDRVATFFWLREAKERGNMNALVRQGVCYQKGYGTETNYDLAYASFQIAEVKTRSSEAQYNLGLCCQNGMGMEIDQLTACQWFLKAAAQGHDEACLQLGILHYQNCNGIPIDRIEALKWFMLAGESGLEWQKKIKGEMSPGDIEKARLCAAGWQMEHAEAME